MIYKLSSAEQERLKQAVSAALSIPFIAGVEGYCWESIFHYVKGLPLSNPHINKRRKLLFDAVDERRRIGWSLKAVQKSPDNDSSFEVVIQRADVIKKRKELGFPNLDLDSSPNELGRAVLTHWNNKINSDLETQKVNKPRIAILLKSRNHQRYALLEQDLRRYDSNDLVWSWTDKKHNGLQARHNNATAFRWYPNQKQLFEVFTLSSNCYRFEINSDPFHPDDLIQMLARSR